MSTVGPTTENAQVQGAAVKYGWIMCKRWLFRRRLKLSVVCLVRQCRPSLTVSAK